LKNVKIKPNDLLSLVGAVLTQLPNLLILKLSALTLTEFDVFAAVVALLKQFNRLESLDLSNSKLLPQQVEKVSETIKFNNFLR